MRWPGSVDLKTRTVSDPEQLQTTPSTTTPTRKFEKDLRQKRGAGAALIAAAFAVVTFLTSCSSTGPHVREDSRYLVEADPPTGSHVTTFYALGDWGTGEEQQMDVAQALEHDLLQLDSDRAVPPFVLGLGDNVYEYGLLSGWNNPITTSLLKSTFEEPYSRLRWRDEPIDFHTVPGNHDYAAGMSTKMREVGYGDVVHQETTAEGLYENWHYYPLSYPGKPDGNDEAEYDHIREVGSRVLAAGVLPEWMTRPEVVDIPDAAPMTALAIDTQGLIERPAESGDPVNDPTWRTLDSLLAASDQPWKFVIGHHPVATYSLHGSYRTLDNWLWTGSGGRVSSQAEGARITLLTTGVFIGALISPAGWLAAGLGLALPALSVVGDHIIQNPQDTDHWRYREFADSLEHVLAKHDAIYLSGHDHSLQLIDLSGRAIQVVSGSAGKESWVASSAPDLHYSAGKPGYARFDVTDQVIWMRFCTVDVGDDPKPDCGPQFSLRQSPDVAASSR